MPQNGRLPQLAYGREEYALIAYNTRTTNRRSAAGNGVDIRLGARKPYNGILFCAARPALRCHARATMQLEPPRKPETVKKRFRVTTFRA